MYIFAWCLFSALARLFLNLMIDPEARTAPYQITSYQYSSLSKMQKNWE